MNIRPIGSEDAEPVAILARAEEKALGRHSHVEPDDVREWWSRTDLERDSWLYEEGDSIVAVGWFSAWGEKGTFAGIVAGGAKGRGLGSEIVDRAESLARERGLGRMHTWVLPEDAAAVALFRSRGYEEVRRFYEMGIELDGPPPDLDVLPGLVLDGFAESDARAFHSALEEAFRDHWEWYGTPFDEWWELRRDQDQTLWFVVRDGDEIAGAVRNENRAGGGYVAILGVRREWRGRGVAKALLYRSFGEFWSRGQRRVTLGVDADSPTGATRLYESVGMTPENVTAVYER